MNPTTLATQIAREAGEIMRKYFRFGMERTIKAYDQSPLTAADLAVNQLVLDRVHAAYPEHRILSEEGNANEQASSEYTWVCDPIDGTIPFSRGIPTSVFSLALLKNGEPIAGVVYDPFMDRMLVAEKGGEATMNGMPTHVSETLLVEEGERLAVGLALWRPHHGQPDVLPLHAELIRRNMIVLNVFSIAYMYMLVAVGELDAVVFQHFEPHDSAAAKLIIECAGGRVTDLTGNEQRYDQKIHGVLATNRHVHTEFLRVVKRYVAPWEIKIE